MTLPLRLLYIAIFQVILTSVITYSLIAIEYQELSAKSVTTLKDFLIKQKKQELKNYTSIALTSVDHIYNSPQEDQDKASKIIVANIFNRLVYNGDDGYFFIYDDHGNNIVHPKEPARVGQNWWHVEDNNGNKVIQSLIKNAKNDGGFYYYNWLKPSEGGKVDKISFSTYMEKWHWMVGTGVYLDDVYLQLSNVKNQIDGHINYTKKIILIVAISSILFIFSFGIIVNINHKKKADAKINELNQRVIDIQEAENRRISRELHDGIIQILISIKFSLEATKLYLTKNKNGIPKPFIAAQENISVTIQEVRRISHHMHPQILDELGLSAAIESLAADFSKCTNVHIQVNKPVLRKLLPDFINTTLFRIVQEAFTNIHKHAKASNILVDISIEKNWLTLIIQDDGVGFDLKKTKSHGIGLRNLAERVGHHHGKFDINSSKSGTKIIVKIPTASFVNYFNKSNVELKNNE